MLHIWLASSAQQSDESCACFVPCDTYSDKRQLKYGPAALAEDMEAAAKTWMGKEWWKARRRASDPCVCHRAHRTRPIPWRNSMLPPSDLKWQRRRKSVSAVLALLETGIR
jgi:hypothetical protein